MGPLLFIIFINDLSDYIVQTSVILYADDTVLYVSHKSEEKIQNNLNQDVQNLLSYFRENELVINLKKVKTETMLFGATKCLETAWEIDVSYKSQRINFAETYNYLGNIVNHHLNFSKNFEKLYKKASSRLQLLERMIKYLMSVHATLIFNIILTFYFSLFNTQSFSYKSRIIKTLFATFDKFTVLFAFKIKI